MGEQLVFIKGMATGRWNDTVVTPIPITIYKLDAGFFKNIIGEGCCGGVSGSQRTQERCGMHTI